MHQTTSSQNFFPARSEESSTVAASGSRRSANRESPPPPSPPPPDDQSTRKAEKKGISKVVAENPIVIVAVLGCFMCITLKYLVQGLGVSSMIIEVEEEEKIETLVKLSKIDEGGEGPRELPAVYVGGKLLGGVEEVMEAHIKGEFVPMLRAAGALWL